MQNGNNYSMIVLSVWSGVIDIVFMIDLSSDKCFKAHDKMPYRWEVKEGDQWMTLPDNEIIEKDYCDPKNINRYSQLTFNGNVVFWFWEDVILKLKVYT